MVSWADETSNDMRNLSPRWPPVLDAYRSWGRGHFNESLRQDVIGVKAGMQGLPTADLECVAQSCEAVEGALRKWDGRE